MVSRNKTSVFFAFQFDTPAISKTDREIALVEALQQARSEIQHKHPDHDISWKECRLASGRPIAEQIADLISACDIFIADISEYNPNVMIELGIAYGMYRTRNKKILYLVHESVDVSHVPSDIRGLFLVRYNSESLRPVLTQQIRDNALDLITLSQESMDISESPFLLKEFWRFPTNDIDIVSSVFPKEEKIEYADPRHRNYLRLGMFADLDSIFHVMINIAKLFPQAMVRSYSPTEFNDLGSNRGLIVIGGPSWNSKFRELQSLIPLRFIENRKGIDDPLIIDGYDDCIFRPSYVSDDRPIKDISLFVRLHDRRGIPQFLIAGCLTFGVLGAARSFLNGNALDNVEYIHNKVYEKDFILVFETEIEVDTSRVSFSHVQDPLLLMKREGPRSRFEVVIENVEQFRSKI